MGVLYMSLIPYSRDGALIGSDAWTKVDIFSSIAETCSMLYISVIALTHWM